MGRFGGVTSTHIERSCHDLWPRGPSSDVRILRDCWRITCFLGGAPSLAPSLLRSSVHMDTELQRTDLSLLEDERGAVFVEYITLTLLVTIGAAGAIAALGIPLARLYSWGVSWILFPLP